MTDMVTLKNKSNEIHDKSSPNEIDISVFYMIHPAFEVKILPNYNNEGFSSCIIIAVLKGLILG